MPDFGDRIRHLRKKRGLTIMDVEKATGIGHSTISRWERGESVPNSSDIYRILMDYFKVDMCYLLGVTDKKNGRFASAARLILFFTVLKARCPVTLSYTSSFSPYSVI